MNKKENLRQKEIKNLVLMIIITAIIGGIILVFYQTRDKNRYVSYNENSDIDYKVKLKENEFYKENYQTKNKGYIATLVDNISANFKYNLQFSEELSYKYSYRIVAEVDVIDDKNDNNIYHYSNDLLKKKIATNKGNLKIDENIDINYQDYNEIISRFKDVYDLNNTDAKLNIYLYINVEDIENTNTKVFSERKVSSLTVPLTEKTISVDIGNNIITNNKNKIELEQNNNYNWVLVIGLFYIIISVIYIIYLIVYIRKTRTAQMVYEKEIKSIMSNYDAYIQKINGSYDIGTSQVLKIETFNDMLEIRDTLKQPILMLENETKDGTFFIIPATNSIIYTYALRVVDIKAKMDGKEIPTYDITEISSVDFMKNKKYTKKYIKDQITMTQAMPKVDDKNIIKGTKNKEKDLYEQLEKTSSFDLKEIRKAQKRKTKTSRKKKETNK